MMVTLASRKTQQKTRFLGVLGASLVVGGTVLPMGGASAAPQVMTTLVAQSSFAGTQPASAITTPARSLVARSQPRSPKAASVTRPVGEPSQVFSLAGPMKVEVSVANDKKEEAAAARSLPSKPAARLAEAKSPEAKPLASKPIVTAPPIAAPLITAPTVTSPVNTPTVVAKSAIARPAPAVTTTAIDKAAEAKAKEEKILLAQLEADLKRTEKRLDTTNEKLSAGQKELMSLNNTLRTVMAETGEDAVGLHPFVRVASRYAGTPYVWGGESRYGFDCSGFIIRVMRDLGYKALPHSAAEQFKYGAPVAQSLLKPGDIVFFANTYKPGISHVGIYIGKRRFIHAASTREGTIISSLDASPYRQKYAGARRLVAVRKGA